MILLFSLSIAHNNFLSISNEDIIKLNGNICISSLLWMKQLSNCNNFNLSVYLPPKIEFFLLQLQELNIILFPQSNDIKEFYQYFQNKKQWFPLVNLLFNNWYELCLDENQNNLEYTFTSAFEEVFQRIFNLHIYTIQQNPNKYQDNLEIESLQNNDRSNNNILQIHFWINYLQSLLDVVLKNRMKTQSLLQITEFIEFTIVEKEYISLMLKCLLNHPVFTDSNEFESSCKYLSFINLIF